MKEAQPGSNAFLRWLDTIQEYFTRVQHIDPKILHTRNRKDVDLKIQFLQDVLEKKIPREKTLYYQFNSDTEKGISRNPDNAASEFIRNYNSIKKNGILTPIVAGRFDTDMIKVRYILKNKKIWSEYKNENGLQLINGTHRLAIALYLKYDSIPVKIFKSHSFQIPDYAGYLQIKREKYLETIREKPD